MKYIIISGGLGNQMFQYAFALALRHRGHHVVMDTSLYNYAKMHNGCELQKVFGIKEPLIDKKGFHLIWLRLLLKFKPGILMSVDPLLFDERCLAFPKKYMFGYWQNEQYFKEIEDTIRRHFTFQNIDERNLKVAQEMCLCNSVSVHIRRGDYETSGMLLLDEDYYSRALNLLLEKVADPVFYIFSDDCQAANRIISKLNKEYKYKIIDWNKGPNSYKDMYLMSHCHFYILANSSFSWWGARLNDFNEKIVIAPKCWVYNNPYFCPQVDGWIKL